MLTVVLSSILVLFILYEIEKKIEHIEESLKILLKKINKIEKQIINIEDYNNDNSRDNSST